MGSVMARARSSKSKKMRTAKPDSLAATRAAPVVVDELAVTREGHVVSRLELLDAGSHEAVAVEDSDVGIAAAKAAGLRCVAVLGTLPPERLGGADEIIGALDPDFVRRALA